MIVNGVEKPLPRPMTAQEYLDENGSLLPKASFAETMLEDGDTLEIVSFVGGG